MREENKGMSSERTQGSICQLGSEILQIFTEEGCRFFLGMRSLFELRVRGERMD
jgi:hypothetical protein